MRQGTTVGPSPAATGAGCAGLWAFPGFAAEPDAFHLSPDATLSDGGARCGINPEYVLTGRGPYINWHSGQALRNPPEDHGGEMRGDRECGSWAVRESGGWLRAAITGRKDRVGRGSRRGAATGVHADRAGVRGAGRRGQAHGTGPWRLRRPGRARSRERQRHRAGRRCWSWCARRAGPQDRGPPQPGGDEAERDRAALG
jgi:hypothetical protein